MKAICRVCQRLNENNTKATTSGALFLYCLSNGVHEAGLWQHPDGYTVRLACDGLQVTDIPAPTKDEALRIAEEHTLFI